MRAVTTSPAIDPSRLETLRSIAGREKGALESARERMQVDIDLSERLRREILQLGRRIERSGGEDLHAERAAKEAERARAQNRIATATAAIENLEKRHRSASRLRRSCETFLATGGRG